MEQPASLYPSLPNRKALPTFYAPATHALVVLPWLLPKHGRVLATFPVVLGLTLSRPYFTSGPPIEDYNSSTQLFALLFVYLDFLILSPATDEEPRFVGSLKVLSIGDKKPVQHIKTSEGVGIDDDLPLWERFKLALRLSFYGRGIGWNWQVKNVPPCTDAHWEKWAWPKSYVGRRLLLALSGFVKKSLTVYLLGMALTLDGRVETRTQQGLVDVAIGWLVTAYAWHGLKMFNDLGAAVTVAAGVFDQWEWPPIVGPLKEMWSIRQAWSVVWHQITRRGLHQPAVRLTRLLGLRKGTLSSKYFQLYATFAMSLLLHEWAIFNATRQDVGEFRYFMLQPLAITLEDFVQHCWRSWTSRTKTDKLTSFERAVGWAWTFLWFSWSIPPYAKGLVYARITGYDSEGILRLGQQHAADIFHL